MKTQFKDRCMQWECCGFLWQLIISRLFPERDVWFPVCPKCGSRGKSFKEIKYESYNKESSRYHQKSRERQ
jgi:hypothetical protein